MLSYFEEILESLIFFSRLEAIRISLPLVISEFQDPCLNRLEMGWLFNLNKKHLRRMLKESEVILSDFN